MPLTIAITGASGSIYALKLINILLQLKYSLNIILTETAHKVISIETSLKNLSYNQSLQDNQSILQEYFNSTDLKLLSNTNLASSIASGTCKTSGLIIIPASMGMTGRIASGYSNDLISRVADVALKEKNKFILVPRETPLSTLHLENLLKLSQYGVDIIPAMPGFYKKPQSLDDLVNLFTLKILDSLGIESEVLNSLRWG